MTNTELRKQRIDRADLHAGLSTGVAKGCRGDMVFTVGLKQRQRAKTLDDLSGGFWPRKALQEFLENQPGRDDNL
ncbi:hypothetical protein BURK2_03251 [Burkholderiales bacterium]|nr:hypothetical protein BURK2_03251 [Burkholderiales bacterium]